MTSAPVVRVHGGQLILPHGRAGAMELDSRDRLILEPDEMGGMVSRYDPLRIIKRRLKRRPAEVVRCGEGSAGWSGVAPSWLTDGSYRIVSYDPQYLLIRTDGADEAADRAAFWEAISDYHEHREHDRQDDASATFSRWFAEVVAGFHPKRVLELGCGGGRNLAFIARAIPGVEVVGVEINPTAADVARSAIGDAGTVITGSLYDLPDLGTFDVAFTAGVLMHIPHGDVEGVVRKMAELASTVLHFELHGESKAFDFHRYPRDYGDIYHRLGLEATYRVLDRKDPLNAGESVGQMALLTHAVGGPTFST